MHLANGQSPDLSEGPEMGYSCHPVGESGTQKNKVVTLRGQVKLAAACVPLWDVDMTLSLVCP